MRRPRRDEPGSWHHVMNRGIGRRTVFETRAGIRFFLAQVARAVRRGELCVHAYCVMATHFHLLVESPRGLLSTAMRRVENTHVRWFNRRAKRDGPLFRGRFMSKLVAWDAYRRTLVRYLDHNPVDGGAATLPEAYEYSSAHAYVSGNVPPWLETGWVLGDLRSFVPQRIPTADAYRAAYGEFDPDTRFLAERFIARTDTRSLPDDVLVLPQHGLASWILNRARRADQCTPGIALIGPDTLLRHVETMSPERRRGPSGRGRPRLSHREAAEVGLLRELCCLEFEEIAVRLDLSVSTAKGRQCAHRRYLASDPEYVEALGAAAEQALRAFNAGPGPAFYRKFVPGTVRN